MKGKQIIDKILEQYKHEDINFDMYIVADAQTKTVRESDPRISHADESEFFSRMEFAEIASALFNVFGFARVFYSEISFIEYVIHNKIQPKDCIVVCNFLCLFAQFLSVIILLDYNVGSSLTNQGQTHFIPNLISRKVGLGTLIIRGTLGLVHEKKGLPVKYIFNILPKPLCAF